MIAFGSIDPHKGKMGGREARKLVEEYGVRGFKFHPTVQGFEPGRQDGVADLRGDRRAQAAGDLPQRPFGHRLGHALRRGLRLQNSNPMLVEDVAMAFPDMQIVLAHPELAVAGRGDLAGDAQAQRLDRPLGWSPKYFRRSSCSTRTRCSRTGSCSAATSR
jgi:predicted TIM-barrel fold metal-dependent hydrolase